MAKETEEQKRQQELINEIAENIAALASSVKSLLKGRLKEKTIYVLLSHSTKLPQEKVRAVLEAAANLERDYLK